MYERKSGDTWAFWIICDRIPVAIAIAAVYLGLGPRTWGEGTAFFGALAMLITATTPQRAGLVIALDYLTRVYWPDPDDPTPPLVHSHSRSPSPAEREVRR